VRFIRGAGKEPVERNSLYDAVRTFEDDEIPDDSVGSTANPRPVHELTQPVGTERV
jgi:hypothetical protein